MQKLCCVRIRQQLSASLVIQEFVPTLLTHISPNSRPFLVGIVSIQCNAGIHVTILVRDLPGYGPVWFDPRAIANVLSLKLVKEKYHIEYNSNKDDGFVVTKPTGEKFKFIQSGSGLHYVDTMLHDTNKSADTTLVVNTVRENKKNYTNNDYLHALRAWELQVMMG